MDPTKPARRAVDDAATTAEQVLTDLGRHRAWERFAPAAECTVGG